MKLFIVFVLFILAIVADNCTGVVYKEKECTGMKYKDELNRIQCIERSENEFK